MIWWDDPFEELEEEDLAGEPDALLDAEETHLRESLARARDLLDKGIPEGGHFVSFFQSALDDVARRRGRSSRRHPEIISRR